MKHKLLRFVTLSGSYFRKTPGMDFVLIQKVLYYLQCSSTLHFRILNVVATKQMAKNLLICISYWDFVLFKIRDWY